jgi:hypothetical protein
VLSAANGFVFPGRSNDKPMSNMVLLMTMRRMKSAYTVHGFRSAFRDWASERTNFAREICEAAQPTSKDKTEAANSQSSEDVGPNAGTIGTHPVGTKSGLGSTRPRLVIARCLVVGVDLMTKANPGAARASPLSNLVSRSMNPWPSNARWPPPNGSRANHHCTGSSPVTRILASGKHLAASGRGAASYKTTRTPPLCPTRRW